MTTRGERRRRAAVVLSVWTLARDYTVVYAFLLEKKWSTRCPDCGGGGGVTFKITYAGDSTPHAHRQICWLCDGAGVVRPCTRLGCQLNSPHGFHAGPYVIGVDKAIEGEAR